MRLIWWILIAIIVFIYVRYYFRSPQEVAILQTTLRNFTFDILREKQPLVIQDRVADIQDIKNTWFKHSFVTDLSFPPDEYSEWHHNKYKYLVLHPSTQCEVLLYSASASAEPMGPDGAPPENATLVAIQLAENQMVIIPYRMHWSIQTTAHVSALGIHDLVTRFMPY